MSVEAVQEIIVKALQDTKFRDMLFSNPDRALKGYELTEEEANALKTMDKDRFDSASGELEDRISRAGSRPFPRKTGVFIDELPVDRAK